MMNRVSILLVSALLMCACSNVEDFLVKDNGAINFTANAMSLSTRSQDSELATTTYGNGAFTVDVSSMDGDILTRGEACNTINDLDYFGVTAFTTASNFTYTQTSATLIDNAKVKVAHDDSNNCFYSPIAFWPLTSDYVTFMAYSPYVELNTPSENGMLLKRVAGENNFTIDYTVPEDAENQPDLMVADFVKDKTTAVDRTSLVPENFKHALAAVGFRIRGNKIKVKSVYITNLKNSGTLLCYDSANSDSFTWTLKESKADLYAKLHFNSKGKELVYIDNAFVDVDEENFMMMLPQTFDENVVLNVDYIDKDGNDCVVHTRLDETAITEWKAGVKYTYNLTITPYYGIEVTPVNYDFTGNNDTESNPRTYTVKSTYIPSPHQPEKFMSWHIDESTLPSWIQTITKASEGTDITQTYLTIANPNSGEDLGVTRDQHIQLALPVENVNLGAEETANCYLVNAAGTYYFPANVMGVGDSGVDPLYAVDYLGNHIGNARINVSNAYAKLLWQTDTSLIKSVELIGDNIHFETAPQTKIRQGNALIAIVNKGADPDSDADDKIMWNWHIWLTNVHLDKDAVSYDYADNKRTFLPFQLGFQSNSLYCEERSATITFVQDSDYGASVSVLFYQAPYEEYLDYHCCYYKWGKKDPFICNTDVKYGKRNLYDINNEIVHFTIPASQTQETTLDYGITSPLTMVYHNSTTWSPLLATYPDLWGDNESMAKTIYDPCPKNYRIPRRGYIHSGDAYYTTTTHASTLYLDEAKTRSISIPHMGAIYGRSLPYFNYYGSNAEFGYIWLSYRRPSSSYAYNRYAFSLIKNQYSENTGQSCNHMHWCVGFKYD